jgi:hypothetical protein
VWGVTENDFGVRVAAGEQDRGTSDAGLQQVADQPQSSFSRLCGELLRTISACVWRQGNKIENIGGVAMAKMLVFNKSLRALNLADNDLAQDFAREFAKSIRTVYDQVGTAVIHQHRMMRVMSPIMSSSSSPSSFPPSSLYSPQAPPS